MATAGIVAEFNPFHAGHRHLVEEIRTRLGVHTPIVAAMSPSFTQRGEAALCTPAARAEMALQGGVNLVLELPVGLATASAESFARGGVGVLAATGVVDTLCFGSESGDLPLLQETARVLDTPAFSREVKERAREGLPFAAARARALEALLPQTPPSGPNDLLATEYLRALPPHMTALAVPRADGGHDGARSSKRVRDLLRAGHSADALALLPEESRKILLRETEQGRAPAFLEYGERALLYRLRTMTEQDFARIPDCGEGLEHRLVRAAGQAASLEEFYALAKSKRYAHARVRRIALRAFLGLERLPEGVHYLGVLAADRTGLDLLRQMKETARVPVVTKPAHGNTLPEPARQEYRLSRRADDLWGLCLAVPQPAGAGWRDTPILLER